MTETQRKGKVKRKRRKYIVQEEVEGEEEIKGVKDTKEEYGKKL